MTGFVVKRVRHACTGGKARWVQMPQGVRAADVPPCALCGVDVTRALKGDLRYDCIWRAGGKQLSKTFTTAHAAQRHLANVVKETHDGTYVHVRPTPMSEVFDKWVSHSVDVRAKQGVLKPSTVKSYKSMLKIHLRPAFEGYRSDRLTADVLSEWERKQADAIAEGTLSAKSFNHLVTLLHTILKWARNRAQRYLSHDPLTDVSRLRVPRLERRFLEPSELKALLEAAEPPDDTILYLMAYTGLRRGETFALQWGDLDEVTHHLRVRRSNYQGQITAPKTTHSERTVDLPAVITARLLDYRTRYPILKDGYIFRTETGTPLDPDNWFGRHFVPTGVRAGLRPAVLTVDHGQLVGLHTLRHTYASLLINQGESIKYVSKQLGHASINITADLYGHLFKETSVSAMNKLSLRISGPRSVNNLAELPNGTDG